MHCLAAQTPYDHASYAGYVRVTHHKAVEHGDDRSRPGQERGKNRERSIVCMLKLDLRRSRLSFVTRLTGGGVVIDARTGVIDESAELAGRRNLSPGHCGSRRHCPTGHAERGRPRVERTCLRL